jgi:hypothetical protein
MASHGGLETLSAELFSEIILYLPACQDRVSLSLVSKRLYDKVIPYIYSHWEFNGYDHSFKSFYLFLRTMFENRVLASHVQSLDIRDWNMKRSDRLADEDDESPEERARLALQEEIQARRKAEKALLRQELQRQEALEEEMYDQYIPLFRNSLDTMLVSQAYSSKVDRFQEYVNNRDPDILLGVLTISLPNLATLYMTIPEELVGVLTTLAEFGGGLVPGILENLNTIYVCSALYLGVGNHFAHRLVACHFSAIYSF